MRYRHIVALALVVALGLAGIKATIFVADDRRHEAIIASAKKYLIEQGVTGRKPTYHLWRVIPCSWHAVTGVMFKIYSDDGSWYGVVCWHKDKWKVEEKSVIK